MRTSLYLIDCTYVAHDLLERSRESSGFVTSGLPQLSKRSPIVLTQQLRATRNFYLFDNDKPICDLLSIYYKRDFRTKDCKEIRENKILGHLI